MKMKLVSLLLVFWLKTTAQVCVPSLDKEMSLLAVSLSKVLVAQGK